MYNSRTKLQKFADGFFTIIVIIVAVAFLATGVYYYIEYDKALYHRKYPNTTEFDYWMDNSKK